MTRDPGGENFDTLGLKEESLMLNSIDQVEVRVGG